MTILLFLVIGFLAAVSPSQATTFSNIVLTDTSNQIVLGTGTTTTLTVPTPASNRVLTIPDLGCNGDALSTCGLQSLTGLKTISALGGSSSTLIKFTTGQSPTLGRFGQLGSDFVLSYNLVKVSSLDAGGGSLGSTFKTDSDSYGHGFMQFLNTGALIIKTAAAGANPDTTVGSTPAAFYISPSGDVGIGTSGPAKKFDVRGQMYISDTISYGLANNQQWFGQEGWVIVNVPPHPTGGHIMTVPITNSSATFLVDQGIAVGQTVQSPMTFNGGTKWQSAGGTPTLYNHYEKYVHSTYLTHYYSDVVNLAYTAYVIRNGDEVKLKLFGFEHTIQNEWFTSYAQFLNPLPERFWPPEALVYSIRLKDNDAWYRQGCIFVGTDGSVIVRPCNDAWGNLAFTHNAVAGWKTTFVAWFV